MKTYDEKIEAALNQSTPAELEELSKDSYWFVRWSVALNPNTPEAVLEELSRDEDWKVRLKVAKNPSTPAVVLQELSKDIERVVQQAAENSLKK